MKPNRKLAYALLVLLVPLWLGATCGPSDEDLKRAQNFGNLCRNHLEKGEFAPASEWCNKALEADPDDLPALIMSGIILSERDRLKEAETYFKRAIEANPESSEARNNYATLLMRQGRYEEAIPELETALANMTYANTRLARLNLCECYLQLENCAEAEAVCWRAWNADREDCFGSYMLGRAYECGGKTRQALERQMYVVQVCPNNDLGHYHYARLRQEMHDLDEACEHYRWIVDNAPESPFHLAAYEAIREIGCP